MSLEIRLSISALGLIKKNYSLCWVFFGTCVYFYFFASLLNNWVSCVVLQERNGRDCRTATAASRTTAAARRHRRTIHRTDRRRTTTPPQTSAPDIPVRLAWIATHQTSLLFPPLETDTNKRTVYIANHYHTIQMSSSSDR